MKGSSPLCALKERYIDPVCWLWHLCATCTLFSRFFNDRHARDASSVGRPWRIVLYADEITPGNVLRPGNPRKIWGIYWSIVEFGATCLSGELGWHTLCCIRSQRVKDLSLTCIVRHLLKTFEPFEIGVVLTSVTRLVVARVAIALADEAALKNMFEFKGASGILPCPFCSNVVLRSSELHEFDGTLKPHSVTSLEGCVQHTDDSVVAIIRRLRSQMAVLTKKKFEDLQKSLGFNFVPDGILDGEVLGITALHFDWAHCVLIQGTFHIEAHVYVLLSF